MPSPATAPTANAGADADAAMAAQRRAIAEIEARLWADGFNAPELDAYQAAFRQLEALIAARGADTRHRFVIVIPVADRPQHLRSCLDSVLECCRSFGYGGMENGRYAKIAVVIADDSQDAAYIAGNRQLADEFTRLGLATTHFDQDAQFALVESVESVGAANAGELGRGLGRILGNARREAYGHKGQGVMRNIAYLQLGQRGDAGDAGDAGDQGDRSERVLFYSIDSDQEFKVKVATAAGDRNVCAVNFFYRLDEIFTATDALVLTGKVVGDPPVSPAVMTGNFLDDVIGFLQPMAARPAAAGADAGPCRHHAAGAPGAGEAAYHDMADLFGFGAAAQAYQYRCPLSGDHSDADCFDHFAARLNSFFYGEHPTRVSYYLHHDALASVQPARTVYAGNYIFRPAALKYFIPFAALRLRMSGPTLGRLIRAEIGPRFVSANLPMLHKRTVDGTGQSEFRPGIHTAAQAIDLSGEFERQFYGDVMLFAIERLTAMEFPRRELSREAIAATMATVRTEMLERYNAKHGLIVEKLGRLNALLHDPAQAWNQSARHAAALANFASFAANVKRNFGEASCYERLNAAANWQQWRDKLLDAVIAYPADCRAWQQALVAVRPAP